MLYTASRKASCSEPDDWIIIILYANVLHTILLTCVAVHIATVVVRVQSSRVRLALALQFLINNNIKFIRGCRISSPRPFFQTRTRVHCHVRTNLIPAAIFLFSSMSENVCSSTVSTIFFIITLLHTFYSRSMNYYWTLITYIIIVLARRKVQYQCISVIGGRNRGHLNAFRYIPRFLYDEKLTRMDGKK